MTTTETRPYSLTYYANSTPESLPELDTLLIFQLIKWAEADEEWSKVGQQVEEFAGWGHWVQGSWAGVSDQNGVLTQEDRVAQRNGECGTSFCMAGQAAWQSGYRMLFDNPTRAQASACVQQEITDGVDAKGYQIWRDVPGAPARSIQEVAQERLGLTEDESNVFFEGDNTVRMLKGFANTMCAARALPLLFPGRCARMITDQYGLTPDLWHEDDYTDDNEDE